MTMCLCLHADFSLHLPFRPLSLGNKLATLEFPGPSFPAFGIHKTFCLPVLVILPIERESHGTVNDL